MTASLFARAADGSYKELTAVEVSPGVWALSISGSGGGGGGGDASAANQATQIALETAIRDRLPAALVSGRLVVDASGTSLTLTNNYLTDAQLRASAVTVTDSKASAATIAQIAASTTSVQLFASNSAALHRAIYSAAGSSALRVKLGATASATSFTVLLNPGDFYEIPITYTGAVHGIWDTTTGSCQTTVL
jgi:hypothetical protein